MQRVEHLAQHGAGEQTRAQLQESEERFRLTFENAPIGMALVALDGRFARVNRALCEIVGYGAAELTQLTFQQITHPDDLDTDVQLAGKLYRGEIPRYQMAKRYFRKDGVTVDVMLHGAVLRNERGEALYFIAQIEDITPRKRREEALQQTQERLELALRGADLATWDWNVVSGEVAFNPRWAQMRGFALEEIRGHVDSWIASVHPDDWPQVKHVLDEHLQGHAVHYETEHRARTKTGEWIWILDRGTVVERDEHGAPLRMAGTELDITARKHAEEALRFAEAKAAGIIAIASDAIVSIDNNRRITVFNEGAEKIFGYTKQEAVGALLDMLVPERFRAVHQEHVRAFAAGDAIARRAGQRMGVGLWGRRKSGEEFPLDASISKFAVGGQQVLTVVLRDITEQVRIEREQRFLADLGPLLAETLNYDQMLECVCELVIRDLADVCMIDLVEDAQVRRLKVLARDPAQKAAADALTHIQIDRRLPHLAESVLKTKSPLLVERVTPKDLTAWSQSPQHRQPLQQLNLRSLIAAPLHVRGRLLGVLVFMSSTRTYGAADLCFAEELGRRAALSMENARLYEAATRAILARDEVLGIVAHDLRNPLNAIALQTSMLCRRGPEPERRSRRPIDRIESAVKRMNRLIQDLLDITRIEAVGVALARECIASEDLVNDVVAAQGPLALTTGLKLESDFCALPEIWADRDRLLQVFENLIGNAMKFTEPGGTITVGARPQAGELLFWVADTGKGIPNDQIPHLFDRFWQGGGRARQGAGLGLPIVKGIVEAHGGRIWVESAPLHGSRFVFTIPTQAPAGQRPCGPSQHQNPALSSELSELVG